MKDTSWDAVSSWYQKMVNDPDSYQRHVIQPCLFELLGDVSGKTVVDIACGVGFYSKILADAKAKVIGLDVGESLVEHAKKLVPNGIFHVLDAQRVGEVARDADAAITILALQNIRSWQEVVKGVSKILKNGGTWTVVLNHPMYRISGGSSWGVDEERNIQYRRVERYMTALESRIDMNPGKEKDEKEYTVSFHWPLSSLINECGGNGLVLDAMQEWVSHKQTQEGKRKQMEDRARKEIPLFMALRFKKI